MIENYKFDLNDPSEARLRDYFITPVNTFPGQYISGVRVFGEINVEPFSKHLLSRNILHISSLGYMSYSSSHLLGAEVGRYCSIASNVKLMGDNHPTDWVTSHVFAYGPKYQEILHNAGFHEWDARSRASIKPATLSIGNDVWIGRDAVLARGIVIGDGAIIAGSSVVTKDVPPYAIVGGVPAKVIRYRFPDEIVKEFLEVKWWNYRISSFGNIKFNNVERFLSNFKEYKLLAIPHCRIPVGDLLNPNVGLIPSDLWI